ncbi:MAG: response regulator [Spirochaetaceae bacterium]
MSKTDVHIMIVEDEGVVALDIQRHLVKFGYEITGIHPTGEEAVEAFLQEEPDLILMDIRLQGKLDGFETAEIIKKHRLVPIVLLTAYADEKTLERAKDVQPFGYIIKPFEERELRTTIEMALYRHTLEEKLYRSEERYRSFFLDDLSGDFVCDSHGNFIACNDAFAEIFGYKSREEAERDTLFELIPNNGIEEELWEELKSKKKLVLKELELIRKDGSPVILLANIVGSFDKEGGLKEIKGYLVDISKRRELETQLRQSQKLEAIGRLAGGVAHDFNNILTIILGYSTMMREKLSRKETPSTTDIGGIEEAAKRASALTRQLLAFSRRQVLKPKSININKLVKNIEKMISRLIDDNIDMRLSLTSSEDLVWVDPGQMEQVLINLVVNARDAMPKGGTITIATDRKQVHKPVNSKMGMIPRGEYVLLSVRDNGTGIDEKTIGHVFEPFFTTKPEEKGTGLGLSTVYGIIKQSDGYVTLDTKPGKGTTFTVYLPVSEESSEYPSGESIKKEKLKGDERVLVVEDEDGVRRLTRHILESYGYTVYTAEDPQKALALCEELEHPLDLLITDMVMPHMNGLNLSEKLLFTFPEIKILFMSGYPQFGLDGKPDRIPEKTRDFIAKPFEPLAFMHKIRSLLDSNDSFTL